MDRSRRTRIGELLDRIARVSASGVWSEELNPAQRAALAYLARANRFSRAPSHVADYLCTTRGTASQTLKALERKGFIAPSRSTSDRRSIAYELTPQGLAALGSQDDLDEALSALDDTDAEALGRSLETTARRLLAKRGFRSFGVCSSCRHHQQSEQGRHCALLQVALSDQDAGELCHEHEAAA